MAIDTETVKRVATLARIKVEDAELPQLESDLNAVLGLLDKLSAVDVDGVEPMTSVVPTNAPLRKDIVSDGNKQKDVLANAPVTREGFFAVPKVVE